jgi:hypothetical protein
MKRIVDNQRGAFLVIFAIALMVLLAFVALAIEGGRWYLVRAELSKSVDAAALAGANNISNPYVDPRVVARDFGAENFQAGYVGTPGSGAGSVNFVATMVDNDKISVTGNVTAVSVLAQMFGVDSVPVGATGIGQKRKVEILMVLDRSASMAGSKLTALKSAARSFLSFFQDTQDKDKLGLVSFATTARVDVAIENNFYNNMYSSINGMSANGYTNAEDALAQANTSGGFSDQTGIPGDQRIQQFVVFFSDGMPTALRDRFKYDNVEYDGIVAGGIPDCRGTNRTNGTFAAGLYNPQNTSSDVFLTSGGTTFSPTTATGDGKKTTGSPLTACTRMTTRYLNTKWYLFEANPAQRSAGVFFPAEQCSYQGSPIPLTGQYSLISYFCDTARLLAQNNATALKSNGIKIYVIGLGSGSEIDVTYLQNLSSGTGFTYVAPTSADLQSIFNKIAKDIKLRLSM